MTPLLRPERADFVTRPLAWWETSAVQWIVEEREHRACHLSRRRLPAPA